MLAIENFGTRQSKGFGCFMPERIEGTEEDLFRKIITHSEIFACYRKRKPQSYFSEIAKEWREIKGGLSNPFKENSYEKSDLMKYFLTEKQTRWEKRFMKKKIKNNHRRVWDAIKPENHSKKNRFDGDSKIAANENYQYIRALLGLAEHNEYGTINSSNSVKVNITDTSNANDKNRVDRFQSPVTYKVTGNYIYLIVRKIPFHLANKSSQELRKFRFELNAEVNGRNERVTLGDSLTVPKNFDFEDFFDSDKLDNECQSIGESISQSYGYEKL